MGLFQNIRQLFGLKTEIQDSPVEILDKLIVQKNELESQLSKAHEEYEEGLTSIAERLKECDADLIKGGNETLYYNQLALQKKATKLSYELHNTIAGIVEPLEEKKEQVAIMEAQILQKAIATTALLDEDEQKEIGVLMKVWEMTGVVKGEEYDSHLKAILAAIDSVTVHQFDEFTESEREEEVNKAIENDPEEEEEEEGEGDEDIEKGSFVGGAGSRGGKVIGHTKSGKPIYDSFNHAGHDRFSPADHADAAKAQRGRKTQSQTNRYVFNNHAKKHEEHAQIKKAEDIIIETEEEYNELLHKSFEILQDAALEGFVDPDFIEELIKGGRKAAPIGEKRTWSGIEYVKTNHGWIKTSHPHDSKKKVEAEARRHAVADVVAHAENTSTDQLKKVSFTHKSHHIRDAAKREIERRKAEKDKAKPKPVAPVAAPTAVAQSDARDASKPKAKKPAFDYMPSDTLVDPGHKKIEKDFGNKLTKSYDKYARKYEKEFGNVLNTDNARELSTEYQKNKSELSAAVHEPASGFIKKLYEEKLQEKVPKGKSNSVYFTAGGTGAGKTSGLQGGEKSHYDKAHIVYDTNMNTFGSAKKKIDQALSAGKRVRINFTYRDAVDAFENGAVPRSIRIGRTIPIETHIDTHLGSMDTILALKDHYKGNKKVHITVTDNSRGWGNTKKAPITFVKQQEKKYTASDLREKLHEINKKLYESGQISESHYKGFRG